MIRHSLARSCCPALLLCLMTAPSALASTGTGTGGTAAVDRPQVEQVACTSSGGGTCAPGDVLELRGDGLDEAEAVVFMGGRSRADDRRAKPRTRGFHRVTVRVPRAAKSGPVQVAAHRAGRSRPTAPVEVVAKAATAAPMPPGDAAGTFPIAGAHDFGTATNRFGGGRGHKGQDVFAKCGTPIVAALSGRVQMAKFQDRAGNYAVIAADDGTSQAYMHMRLPATVSRGQRVAAGQQIGEVGETGRATGCHLHFELWTAPGWYEGGEAVDPLPLLRQLEGAKRP